MVKGEVWNREICKKRGPFYLLSNAAREAPTVDILNLRVKKANCTKQILQRLMEPRAES